MCQHARMGVKSLGAAIAVLLALGPAASASPRASVARVGAAPAGAPLTLVFPLRADLAGLRAQARAVSTPGSPEYGHYDSVAALAHRYGASLATRRGVRTYLDEAGGRGVRIDATGLFAVATFPAARAERLFATPLATFRTARGARFIAPAATTAAAPRLPAGLRRYATGVVGLDTRPLAAPAPARAAGPVAHAAQASSVRNPSGTPAGCPAAQNTGGFTPNQYLTAYGYDPLHAARLAGQGERVALIEIDGFRYADIRTFANCFGLGIPALNGFGIGVAKPLAPGGEATLDLEVLLSAAPSLKSIDVYETHASAADTLRALTAPLGNAQKPQVISASLGLCEPVLYESVHASGIATAEASLQMAAAAGVTVLASSGDQGSADCTGVDGIPLPDLAVNYPASSWWVTGVGGTNLVLDSGNVITSQVVWNDGADQPGSAGGGGVSDLFARPNYQDGASGASGRGVPDVAMLADVEPGYAIYCTAAPSCVTPALPDPWQTVGGTSASTPLLAGGFALIDQALHTAHRQDLGLVNPLLYRAARAAPESFNDVTGGSNDIGPQITSDGHLLGCCTAKAGYDLASGLGSVNLGAFSNYAVHMQAAPVSIGLSIPKGQSPVRSHQLRVTVSCSGLCRVGAYAEVTIRHHGSFEVDSAIVRLAGRGSRTLALRFSGAELNRLRAGLRGHNRITASVSGVLINGVVYGVLPVAGTSIEKTTPARTLVIHG